MRVLMARLGDDDVNQSGRERDGHAERRLGRGRGARAQRGSLVRVQHVHRQEGNSRLQGFILGGRRFGGLFVSGVVGRELFCLCLGRAELREGGGEVARFHECPRHEKVCVRARHDIQGCAKLRESVSVFPLGEQIAPAQKARLRLFLLLRGRRDRRRPLRERARALAEERAGREGGDEGGAGCAMKRHGHGRS